LTEETTFLTDSQPSQTGLDLAEFQDVELAGRIPHRPWFDRLGLATIRNHQHEHWQAEGFQLLDEITALLIPRQQHADATADGADMVEHQGLERSEIPVQARFDRGQDSSI